MLSLPPSSTTLVTSLLELELAQDSGRLLLGLALCLLLPASLGYVGAVRENKTLLILYFSPILLLWGLQLVFIIVLPVLQSAIHR